MFSFLFSCIVVCFACAYSSFAVCARLRAICAISCPLKFRTRTRKGHASTTFIRSKMSRFVHFIHEIIVILDSLQNIRQYNVSHATCSRVKNQLGPWLKPLGKQSFPYSRHIQFACISLLETDSFLSLLQTCIPTFLSEVH